MGKGKKKNRKNNRKITANDVIKSKGNPMKVAAINEAANEATEAVQNSEAKSQINFLGDDLEINGTTFYKPTALHKLYLGSILETVTTNMTFAAVVTAYILMTPGKQLRKKIYPKIIDGSLVPEALEAIAKVTDNEEDIGEIIQTLMPDNQYIDYGDDDTEKKS